MKKLLEAIIALIGGVGAIILLALYNGWIISLLWNWFLVPLKIPQITYIHAIGISLLVGTFQQTEQNKDTSGNEAVSELFKKIGAKLLMVGMGYIVQLFL